MVSAVFYDIVITVVSLGAVAIHQFYQKSVLVPTNAIAIRAINYSSTV